MKTVQLVFICDNDFVMPTIVAITSIIKNKKMNTNYNIHIILPQNISNQAEKFYKFNSKQIQINIITAPEQYTDSSFTHAHVSKTALLKFNIPNLLDKYNKVLYLDGDIIVQGDLTELFNQNIDNYYAAVIKDMKAIKTNGEPEYYFNSGVMLLNIKKIREEIPAQKFIKIKMELNNNRYQDQDTLNIIFKNNVKFLPVKYNFLTRYLDCYTKREIEDFYNQYHQQTIILHYATKFKPWKYTNTTLGKIWEKYYKKSPYKNENLLRSNLQPKKNNKRNFLQTIFSVRNDERFHKVINFCGIKFKFKNKLKILENEIFHLNRTLKQINHERLIINQRSINRDKVQYNIDNFSGIGVDENSNIIVSLTSYPKRMYDIHYTIYSLLNQTIKPNKIILWLSAEQFPNKESDLGENILKLKKYGLTINFIDGDIKSYKKLIPAIKEYPNNIIITVDDDIYYEENCLEKLYNEYLTTEKKYIIAHRCHKMKMQNNQILPYNKWNKNIENDEASFFNFFTGAGAILYPPHSLYSEVCNEELFSNLAPNADDIWFWAMAVLNNTKIKIPQNPDKTLIYTNPQRELGLNDDGTLFATNKTNNNGNDAQLKNILQHYPQIMDIINQENLIPVYDSDKN